MPGEYKFSIKSEYDGRGLASARKDLAATQDSLNGTNGVVQGFANLASGNISAGLSSVSRGVRDLLKSTESFKLSLGSIGAVASAAFAGFRFGQMIDNAFGISDKISAWFNKESNASIAAMQKMRAELLRLNSVKLDALRKEIESIATASDKAASAVERATDQTTRRLEALRVTNAAGMREGPEKDRLLGTLDDNKYAAQEQGLAERVRIREATLAKMLSEKESLEGRMRSAFEQSGSRDMSMEQRQGIRQRYQSEGPRLDAGMEALRREIDELRTQQGEVAASRYAAQQDRLNAGMAAAAPGLAERQAREKAAVADIARMRGEVQYDRMTPEQQLAEQRSRRDTATADLRSATGFGNVEGQAEAMSKLIEADKAAKALEAFIEATKAAADAQVEAAAQARGAALASARGRLDALGAGGRTGSSYAEVQEWEHFKAGRGMYAPEDWRGTRDMGSLRGSGMIQKVGETRKEFNARTASAVGARIAAGMSPDEELVTIARETNELLQKIRDNTGGVPR